MDDSKIVIAIRKYQRDYAWDKSLTTRRNNPVSTASPEPDSLRDTSIEDFINGSRARKAQRA